MNNQNITLANKPIVLMNDYGSPEYNQYVRECALAKEVLQNTSLLQVIGTQDLSALLKTGLAHQNFSCR